MVIHKPRVAVIHNVDAQSYDDPQQIRDALYRQLLNPVQWVAIIGRMAAHGIGQVLECGPGNVLTGLNKRIARSLVGVSLQNPPGVEKALKLCSGEMR